MDSGRRSLALAALLIGGGCSQLFGLDTPEHVTPDVFVPDTDSDGDGVLDGADNCNDVPNPDQTDVDRDQIGDLCQGCVTLALRPEDDDDTDGLNDTVDNCIGQPSAQADTDNDGIGNACDESDGRDVRFCVWTFRNPASSEDPRVWVDNWQLTGGFSIADSQLTHTPSSPMQLDLATLKTATIESATGVAFDTRLNIKAYTSPAVIGLAMELQSTAATLYTCQVRQPSAGSAVGQLLKDGVVVDEMTLLGALPMVISTYTRFTAINVAGKLQLRCMIDANAFPTFSLTALEPAQPIKMRPRVIADNITVYFDHVTVYKLGI